MKITENLLKIALFAALFFGAAQLVPYLTTRQTYDGGARVSDLFPVAVMRDGQAQAVLWPAYTRNPGMYRDMLLLPLKETRYETEAGSLAVAPVGGSEYRIDYQDGDYRFVGQYSVKGGIVMPASFRYTGSFAAFWALIAAGAGTAIAGWLYRRMRARTSLT